VIRTILIVALVSWMAALLTLGCAAGSALAQPPADRGELTSEESAWRHADLHARYVAARLRLAEVRLEKAERLNAISPGQITETDMRALRTRIELLREQVAETRGQPHGYGFAVQRRAARAAVRLAEQDLAAATAIHGRKADAVSPLDMRFLEIRLDIARLRAQVWDDPAFLASPTDVLQMQIDQLADQLQDMAHHVDNAPALDRR
jgi:polyhydroxyalkanoate synthesis regulator phasin